MGPKASNIFDMRYISTCKRHSGKHVNSKCKTQEVATSKLRLLFGILIMLLASIVFFATAYGGIRRSSSNNSKRKTRSKR